MTNKIKTLTPPFRTDGRAPIKTFGGGKVETTNPFSAVAQPKQNKILASVTDLDPIANVSGGKVVNINYAFTDAIEITTDVINHFTIEPNYFETINTTELVEFVVGTNLLDVATITEQFDSFAVSARLLIEPVNIFEEVAITIDKTFDEVIVSADFTTIAIEPLYQETIAATDQYNIDITSFKYNDVTVNEDVAIEVSTAYADAVAASEALSVDYGKIDSEAVTASETYSIDVSTVYSDDITTTDERTFEASTAYTDAVTPSETYSISISKAFSDSVTVTDLVALHPGVSVSDAIISPTDVINEAIPSIGQNAEDTIDAPTDAIDSFSFTKNLSDIVEVVDLLGVLDGLEYSITLNKQEIVTISELLTYVGAGALEPEITTPTDELALAFNKVLSDALSTPTDTLSFDVGQSLSEILNTPTDSPVFSVDSVLLDSISAPSDSINSFAVESVLSDTASPVESQVFDVSSVYSSPLTGVIDFTAFSVGLATTDLLSEPTDSIDSFDVSSVLLDSTNATDTPSFNPSILVGTDTALAVESISLQAQPTFQDNLSAPTDVGEALMQDYVGGQYFAEDYVGITFTF